MYNGQAEKYIESVITFGDRANITASPTSNVRGYLTAPGGTYAATIEFAVVIPRNGILKNLYWSAEASTLVAAGNTITVYVKDPPTAPSSSPTGLAVSWNGNVRAGSNTTNTVPVVSGDTVSVYFQLARGSGRIDKPRVTIELEVDAQNPNPWDLTGSTVSYIGGNVGIGTPNPAGELHVKNTAAGGVAGVFETPSGKILSGMVGGIEKFNVDAAGNLFTDGNVGIGNTAPSTELDVNGTTQTKGFKMPTGASNGYVLTSDANGAGTWQIPGGGGGSVDGNGTPGAIAKFLGPSTIDDSAIFQNGSNIGIGTATPNTTLEVNGAISGFGVVPIGSIIAWHKSLIGTPSLPDGWAECNGQTLNDSSSTYDGKAIPDLNGEGRFLRGAAVSGILQADEFKKHSHTVHMKNGAQPANVPQVGNYTCAEGHGAVLAEWNVQTDIQGNLLNGIETRPVNMSVIWIMRVK